MVAIMTLLAILIQFKKLKKQAGATSQTFCIIHFLVDVCHSDQHKAPSRRRSFIRLVADRFLTCRFLLKQEGIWWFLALGIGTSQNRSGWIDLMVPRTVPGSTGDQITAVITAVGVIGGLSCLAVVIVGGFITADAAKEGIKQIPIESPIPIKASLTR